MTKATTKAPTKAPTKATAQPAAKAAPAVDRHAGHTTIDSLSWIEAKGAPVAFRLCSCGAKRALEG